MDELHVFRAILVHCIINAEICERSICNVKPHEALQARKDESFRKDLPGDKLHVSSAEQCFLCKILFSSASIYSTSSKVDLVDLSKRN